MNNKGFTLVNVVMGITIFTIVILVVLVAPLRVSEKVRKNRKENLPFMNYINVQNAISRDINTSFAPKIGMTQDGFKINEQTYTIDNGNLVRGHLKLTNLADVRLDDAEGVIRLVVDNREIVLDENKTIFKRGDNNE